MKKVVAGVLAVTLLGAVDVSHIMFSADAIPVVTCHENVLCDLQLVDGDAVDPQRAPAYDPTNWYVVAQAGAPGHVFFQPTKPDAPRTLLTVATAQRTYHVWLTDAPGPVVYAFGVQTERRVAIRVGPDPTPTPAPDLGLYGTYRVTGKAPFAPTRIGTDGIRTYVFFSRLGSYPIPVLIAASGHQQIATLSVHVLADGGREYIIAGVQDHFLLTLGGGKQTVFLRVDREGN